MADVVFREAPPPVIEKPKVDLPEPEVNKSHVDSGESDNEPIEFRDTNNRSIVLDALNIDENINNLPAEDRSNLQEVKDYVTGIIKSKGLSPTVGVFKKTLNSLKSEMGLSKESDPAVILDRIAGVVKAWRNLSFIKDAEEKQRIFIKLAGLGSSKEMNKEVFKLMEGYEIWQ